jgi:trehalose 6-phosphate synthase
VRQGIPVALRYSAKELSHDDHVNGDEMNPPRTRPGDTVTEPLRAQTDAAPKRTTQRDLLRWSRDFMRDKKLVVVSNREPYSHVREHGKVRLLRNVGVLTVALDSVVQALNGLWVAHGHGNADRSVVDERGRVALPPDNPTFTLKRVNLSREDNQLYYSGFSNGALWPLCHVVYVRPRFHLDQWDRYREINQRFADAVLEEVGDAPALVFIQDYHLAMAAKYIKAKRPDLDVALFWHIPWPNAEVFRILPWRRELLEGMLANDVIAFHIRSHAMNFLDIVGDTLEARVDDEQMVVHRGGERTWVRNFPISVDVDQIGRMAEAPETEAAIDEIRERYAIDDDTVVTLGVDRMDYTKGIPERLEALERMFEKYPDWVGKLTHIQIGVPTRVELREYREVITRTRNIARRINERFPRRKGRVSEDHANTVHLIEKNHDFRDVVPYMRMADMCSVTSLHDGMNLVAKEFVAARSDLNGTLVLSPFAGAALELSRAWIASPYDRETLADTFHLALTEKPRARRARMAALREIIARHNIFDWAIEVFDTVQRLSLRTPSGGVEPPWR